MSVDATRWAWKQQIAKGIDKLVLLSYADRADEHGIAYPSAMRLACDTGLNRKTIVAAISRLRGYGLLLDTGERKGDTRSVPVYQLIGIDGRETGGHGPKAGQLHGDPKAGQLSTPESGTPSPEADPFLPGSSPVFTGKLTQIRDTEPKREPTSEPITNDSGKAPQAARDGSGAGKRETIPYQAIVDLFHQRLPMGAEVFKLTEVRKGHIRQRWQNELPDLQQWSDYFDHVAASPFLTGKVPGLPGRPPFRITIDFVINATNCVEIIEGKYHRQQKKTG